MSMVAILFDGTEPFEQTVNILLKVGTMCNLVKIGQAASGKMMFKDFMILYMFITHGQGQITPKILMVTK